MATGSDDLQKTRAVTRAMALLAAIADSQDGARLVDLARSTDLSSSTALRLLRALEGAEFVMRNADGRYDAGGRILQLGLRALSHVPLVQTARPHLEALTKATGESSYLGLPGPNGSVLYAASCPSPQAVRHVSWPGRMIPTRGTAIGAALQGRCNKHGYSVSSRTVVDQATAIAAPIFDETGAIVAAISVVGPTFRLTSREIKAYGQLLLLVTRQLSGLQSMT